MKLLNCHIENFGVLSGFDFDFSEGLTVICKENGFGKSTFAAFIKAMFYGMPETSWKTSANDMIRGKAANMVDFLSSNIKERDIV